jgi:hypothetical protein
MNPVGRPQLPEDEKHSERVAVYLTREEKQLLLSIGALRGVGAGVVARALIKAKLDSIAKFSTASNDKRIEAHSAK